jgi:TonB family protein
MDTIVKSTLILAGAWLVVTIFRRRSAALRHLVWCAAVAALAALPVLTSLMPRMDVAVPAELAAGGPVFGAPAFGATAGAFPATGGAPVPASTAGTSWTGRGWWRWIWLAGLALSLARVLTGIAIIARLRRGARRLRDSALDEAAAELGVTCRVRLFECPRVGVPMAAGVIRPAIYLPVAARTWDADRRRVVLLHELAHILRRDPLTHVAGYITLSALWFHPLAWLAGREMRKESERAADDLVLAAGARPSAYAGHLLEVAESLATPATARWAAVCMVTRSQLEGRLASILDAGIDRATARPALALAAFAVALGLVAPLAAMRPQALPPANPAEMETLIRSSLAARDYETLERLAVRLVAQRKFDEANRLGEAALEMRAAAHGPNSAGYTAGLLQQGRVFRLEGNPAAAEAVYRRVLSIDPANPSATGYMAIIAQDKREYGAAAEQYRRALNLPLETPERVQFLTGLAAVEAELGQDAQAEQHYGDALRAGDSTASETATAAELYARFLTAHGRESEARAAAAQALGIRGDNVRRENRRFEEGEARKVGEAVKPPRLAFKVEPLYTEVARVAKYTGRVVLHIVVAADGSVAAVDLKSGIGLGLDEQAASAVRQWRFEPATLLNGQAVPVSATVEINFRLL